MSIVDMMLGKDKKSLAFVITPLGQQNLQAFRGDGLELRVMQVLLDEGATTLSDLRHRLKTEDAIIKTACRNLAQKEWIVAR